jgi:hypothetical protein
MGQFDVSGTKFPKIQLFITLALGRRMGIVVNTSRYRQLLAGFNEQVSIRDAQAGRLTSKWLESLDHLSSSTQAKFLLADHLSRVSRSVIAIQILAQERGSPVPLVGAREVLEAITADLLSEIERLLKQARRIDEVLSDRGLEMIVGESLSSVEFVMDYVRLGFNESSLTTFVGPQVQNLDRILSETDPGYRDALCALIGVVVSSTEVREEEVLRITFTDGRAITVSLRAEEAVGPEYAYFTSRSGLWRSW